MTFIQYYIEQFRDFAYCCRLAKKPRHWLAILKAIPFLLSPLSIYTIYEYDTGILKPDARYMKKERRND